MAIRDDRRRTPRDYMRSAESRYDQSSSSGKWIGVLVTLAIACALLYVLFRPDTASSPQQAPTATGTSATPSTPRGDQRK